MKKYSLIRLVAGTFWTVAVLNALKDGFEWKYYANVILAMLAFLAAVIEENGHKEGK